MNLPHPKIKRLPDHEVDAVPELWNEGYQQIDENMEAMRAAIDAVDGLLRLPASKNGETIQQVYHNLKAIEVRLKEIEDLLNRSHVRSINGKTGDVVLTVHDFPQLARRENEVFSNLVDNGSEVYRIRAEDMTNLSRADTLRAATVGWVRDNLASLFTNGERYGAASNGKRYFTFPKWMGGFSMEWGKVTLEHASGSKYVNLQQVYTGIYGIFVTADSPHGGLYRAGQNKINGTIQSIRIWWQGQSRTGDSWYLVVGRTG